MASVTSTQSAEAAVDPHGASGTTDADAFVDVDTLPPIDLERDISLCPPHAQCRGIFLSDIARTLKQKGLTTPQRRYVSFRNYSQREFMELASSAALALSPDMPLRQGLRLLGRSAYPAFSQTLIGKVMFGVLGGDIEMTLLNGPKAYETILSVGTAETVVLEPGTVLCRLRDVHTFVDSYQVGVWEGALHGCGADGDIRVKKFDHANADFLIRYR